jgi:hypothetical protein
MMPEERYDSESDAGPAQGKQATEQPRENPAVGDAAGRESAGTMLTLVCERCGKDYFFDDEQPPADMKCEKCGNTVFRSFYETVGEAADDFRDSTDRDTDPDDAEGDVMPGDILDLNRL